MITSLSVSSISELYNRQTQQDTPERTTTPPISPPNQLPHPLKYNHMTIKYAILIKQFITQMVFVKFHMLVIKQTTETLEFMTCRIDNPTNREKDRPTDFDNIYHKILLDHITDDLPKIWDEIFAEHNIDIVFRYFVDIVDHLFEYSTNTTTTDPKYTYSQQTIYRHFYSNRNCWKNNGRWITIKGYSSETYSDFVQFTYETPNVVSSGIPQFTHETPNVVSSGIPQFTYETPNVVSSGIAQRNTIGSSTQNRPSYETYRRIEQEKHLRNRILEDVMDGYIFTLPSDGNPSPTIDPTQFYVYLEHYARRLKQHDGTHIFDKDGNLEITDCLLQKYAVSPTTTTYCEIYTIWLLNLWVTQT
jgi:hypothetical protein